MVKRILSTLVALTMILSLSVSAFASETDKVNTDMLPESVFEEIIDNNTETLAEEAVEPYTRGSFTLTQIHYLERTTGTVNFAGWKPDNFTDSISGRVYNTSGDPRDEAILQFTATAQGLNEDDKIILTVAVRAQNQLGVDGGSVRIIGIVDENYTFNGTTPVVAPEYTYLSTEGLTLDFKNYSFDVTPYVKARLAAGEKKISFLVELVDSDWKTGDGNVYMDLALAPYNVAPVLAYKETALTELSYDGKDIALKEGQKTYTVLLNDDSLPVVSAAATNSAVDITQITAVPGTAVVKVNTHGINTEYKVNFINSDYIGTAAVTGAFNATRSTSNGRFDANLTQGNLTGATSNAQIRTDSSTKLRQEGATTFDIRNLLGITAGQKVTLTVYGYGNTAAVNAGTKVVYRGIEGEGVTAGSKYGTDATFTGTSDIAVTADQYTAYKMDVTDYVKAKIAAGETTVSFALRITEGVNGATFYWYFGGDRNPKLTVEEISTELTDIKVNGESVADFSSSRTTYTHYIADDFVGIPSITVVKKDSGASQYIEIPDVIPGTAIAEITNPSGKSTIYTVKLKYESSKTNPTLYTTLPFVTYKDASTDEVVNTLTAGGKIKAELSLKNLKNEPEITFVTALYNNGFLVSKVSKKKTTGDTVLINTLDINLSDVSGATVKSFILNGYEEGKNIINCATLNSSDTNIKSITMSGYDFTEFDPDVTDYTINVPASVLNYPEFSATARDSGTKLSTLVPVYLSGVVKLTAQAGNGDEKIYTVNIEREKAKITNPTMAYDKLDGVNKKITIFENIKNPVYDPVPGKPAVEGKNQGAEFNKEYAVANCQNPVYFLTDRSNYWIASMDERFEGATMVSVPFDGVNPSNNPVMKDYTGKTGFIEFDINRSATVYVFHTSGGLPSWASTEGFKLVTDIEPGYVFGTASDGGVNMDKLSTAYSKYYSVDEWSEEPVTVSLGSISGHQYWWIIVVFDK